MRYSICKGKTKHRRYRRYHRSKRNRYFWKWKWML